MIAAAGSGDRLGAGGPKALVELAGRPLIEWSLQAFAAARSVGRAVAAVPPDRITDFERAVAAAGEPLELQLVAGAATRSGSVAAAAAEVDTEVTVVHDAARPLVTAELIDAVVADLLDGGWDCVLAAAAVTDTVKEVDGREVRATPERSRLWAAQTPQAFRTEALRAAQAAAGSDGLAGATDDASLLERGGGRVGIHEAPATNLKVTTPLDLRVAELLLAQRDRG